ncbi:hypothetical protein GW17_00015141 [Ensete ventricosum]|nr:hypothetical protein GW17_00015141 [Ensete ventricosum]
MRPAAVSTCLAAWRLCLGHGRRRRRRVEGAVPPTHLLVPRFPADLSHCSIFSSRDIAYMARGFSLFSVTLLWASVFTAPGTRTVAAGRAVGQWDSTIRLPTERAGLGGLGGGVDEKEEEAEETSGTRWALLVAGSSGYGNYRHQVVELGGFLMSNVCHAYQLLRRGGLKEENIVVMMYDDIANNPLNPRPGVIINHPQGHDVYAGVPKVIYVEACESGSIFEGLMPEDLNIYVTTASNAEESSWGTVKDSNSTSSFASCSETHNLKEETVSKQYEAVSSSRS